MNCPEEHELLGFVGRALPQTQMEQIESHLDECSSCRATVSELLKTSRPILDGELEDPGFLFLCRGDRLGRYVIDRCLGYGGMGIVFAAFDSQLNRKVAIKCLRQEKDLGRAAKLQQRLLKEAQSMAQISHPNVVTVYDVELLREQVFLAMEFVEGQTLTSWLMEKPRSLQEILSVFIQAGMGLWSAHQAGLVHRDFKPDNVLIQKDGRARVSDFGLAQDKTLQQTLVSVDPKAGPGPFSPLGRSTLFGQLSGTPAYLAPEVISGNPAQPQSDQYSYCVSLFFALTGELPHQGDTERNAQPASPGFPVIKKIPVRLQKILQKGLGENPGERYSNLEKLLLDLQGVLGHMQKRKIRMAFLTAALLLASLLPWWLGRDRVTCAPDASKWQNVWDQQRMEKIKSAFLATQVAYAQASWEQINTIFSSYLREWLSAYQDACAATHVRGEQSEAILDLRMQCLEGLRMECRSLSNLLVEADKEMVVKAVQAASALNYIGSCADTETLTQQQVPWQNVHQKEQVAQLRQAQADIKALYDSGRYTEANTKQKMLLEEALQIQYNPLLAEAYYWLGELDSKGGSFQAAQETLMNASDLAVQVKQPRLMAMVWTSLSTLMGNQMHNEEGFRFARLAQAAIKSLPKQDPQLLYKIEMQVGNLFEQQGKIPESLQYFQKAQTTAEGFFGKENISVAMSLQRQGTTLLEMEQYPASLDLQLRALAMAEKILHPNHPDVTHMVRTLANVYMRLGQYDLASSTLQRALAADESTYGPMDYRIAYTLERMATVCSKQKLYSKAIEFYERALQIEKQVFGKEHLYYVGTINNLALVYIEMGQTEKAIVLLREALEISEKNPNFSAQVKGRILCNLGELYLDSGKTSQALPMVEQCLAIWTLENLKPCRIARTKLLLAMILDRAGQKKKGFQFAQESLAGCTRESAEGREHLDKLQAWLATREGGNP